MERKEQIAIGVAATILIYPLLHYFLFLGVTIASEFKRFDSLDGMQGIPGIRDLPSEATAEDLLAALRESVERPCIMGVEVDWSVPVNQSQEGSHGTMRIDSAVRSERTFATRHETISSSREGVDLLIEGFCHGGVLWTIMHSGRFNPSITSEPWVTEGIPRGLPSQGLRLAPSGQPHPIAQILEVADSSKVSLKLEGDDWVLILDYVDNSTEFFDSDYELPVTPVQIAFSRSHGGPLWAKWWKDGYLNAEIKVLRFETFDDLSEGLFVFVLPDEKQQMEHQQAKD